MKILMITLMPPEPTSPGAIPPLLHASITGLRLHHDITLLTLVDEGDHQKEAVRTVLASNLEVQGVPRRSRRGWARPPARVRTGLSWALGRRPQRSIWYREPAMQEAIDRIAAGRRFDIIHT